VSELALYEAHNRLAHSEDRFNALAQVAGREMPKYLKRPYAVPLTIGVSVLGAAIEARANQPGKPYGSIGNGLIAAVAYGIGIMASENADLREAAFSVATGLGSAAAAIGTYDWVTTKMATTTAPAPTAQAA
jgi:hypothetical protein